MSIDIYAFTISIRGWSYDNGWMYKGQFRDAYSGPTYPDNNRLIMLNHDRGTAVLHDEGQTPKEV